ncbi:MAG: hypothetical protein M1313_07920 [Nitrospirae bacterium]|nr:hypothetical protein [Nitrospirota bacterium]
MTEFQEPDEGEGERPLGVIPSYTISREEVAQGFRSMRRILWGVVFLMAVNVGATLLLSGDRSVIVALSSDGHMQLLSRISDTVYRKNLDRILRTFATDFLANLTAYDSFEVSYRFEKALSVMTPELRLRTKREIVAQNLVETVRKARIHTALVIRNFSLHRVASGVWSVDLSGERTTTVYGQEAGRTQGFAGRLLVRKGGATVFNPYGLWVENFQERPLEAPSAGSRP